ncbi:MAG: alpha-amylase family glycosyl hydrolase [Bacteroidia bacterium]
MFLLRYAVGAFLVLVFSSSYGQKFSAKESRQGFAQRGDTTWFLFDREAYAKPNASKVVVTGSFRGWSQDMNDPSWILEEDKLFLLNPNYTNIPPRAEFKFRIDNGEWLSPPADATNTQGGNLVFMQDITPPSLRAELTPNNTIWARIDGAPRSLLTSHYRLLDADQNEIPIAEILPNTQTEILIIPAQPIDKRKVYHLEIPDQKLKSWCSYDGWFRTLYSNKTLGAEVQKDGKQTAIRLFAPRAESVWVYLYDEMRGGEGRKEPMQKDENGVWETFFAGDMSGTWYDFTVHGADQPGNHFFDKNPKHISDPYARVNDDAWGRSMVTKATKPATKLLKGIPKLKDLIAYEVHIQDFTDLLPVPDNEKGTIPAFHKPHLKNEQGEAVGFDYLVDLGINVVHLQPMQEFMHHPDELWQEAFKDDPDMIAQDIHMENYQWGYRTSHAFAVENRFRRKGDAPGAERTQFRNLVQAFHDKNMAVIIDIVPNHTAEDMDGGPHFFHWDVIDKIYHYRTKDLDHIGEYGNEVKFENRPMVQRWLIDQCKHWIEEFGIDGFRIDLAGQVDRQTLIKLREELGPDIIIYGEPWIGSNDPDFETNPSWDWYKHNSPICFFQDDARNAFKGPTGNPQEKERDRGWAGANYSEFEKVKMALSASFADDKTPLSGISYLDIHDNWALADRFATTNWDGRMGVDEDRYKIAALLLYTSLGPIVTHGGTEIMRSKGSAPLAETFKTLPDGRKLYFHGKRDSYNLRKANRFVWEQVGATTDMEEIHCDYKGMHAFWRGLNHFRLSEAGKVFRVADSVSSDYYQWIDTPNPYQLGYLVDNKVLVLINTGSDTHDFKDVQLPPGTWKLIGNNSGLDHKNGVKDKAKNLQKIKGGKSYTIELEGVSFKVWILEEN